MLRHTRSTVLAGALVALSATAPLAQGGPGPRGSGPGGGGPGMMGMGPGSMMGPGMMGGGGFGFTCNPRAAGLAEWRMQRIESTLKPTDAQKQRLEDLRAASTKAGEIIQAACAGEVPSKAAERLGLMEKRLEAMQQAVKTVRPAFEAFYASLDDAQKARLDEAGPRGWGWGSWRWRWN